MDSEPQPESSAAPPPPAPRVIGHLDTPTLETVRLGEANVFSGWAVVPEAATVSRVAILYGDEVIGSCEHNVVRQDVHDAYPTWAGAMRSGFRGTARVPSRPSLPLTIHVWDSAGHHYKPFQIDPRLALLRSDPRYGRLAGVNRRIHPHCEMFLYARGVLGSDEEAAEYYFASAEFLIYNLLAFAEEQGLDLADKSILDFASGYGRLARYFGKLFAEVAVADTEQAMLDFNREELGVEGFLSSPSSSRAVEEHPGRYDVVFCFSLFTHLNQAVWTDWFRKLFALVAPGGYFIISTHSHALLQQVSRNLPAVADGGSGDFVFWSTNETGQRLDDAVYGTSVVTAEYVRKVCEGTSSCRLVKKYEAGAFDLYHDVYVFQNDRVPGAP